MFYENKNVSLEACDEIRNMSAIEINDIYSSDIFLKIREKPFHDQGEINVLNKIQ
jgi:hypothetical protein